MAQAIKCDRCGKFETGKGKYIGTVMSVCEKCYKEFEEWWKRGENSNTK